MQQSAVELPFDMNTKKKNAHNNYDINYKLKLYMSDIIYIEVTPFVFTIFLIYLQLHRTLFYSLIRFTRLTNSGAIKVRTFSQNMESERGSRTNEQTRKK